jgi:D-lactate dehydrogenase (cytochrome)
MACTNASGARSLAYGPMRRHVQALRLVLPDGSALALARGRERANGLDFRLVADSGRLLAGALPRFRPPAVKNSAGLFVQPDMDLLDLVIGAEGTLGVITELELRLSPQPPQLWALQGFFPELAGALRFAAQAGDRLAPAALEFFDGNALRLLAGERRANPAFADLPDPPAAAASIYAEFHTDSSAAAERTLTDAAALLESCGGDPGLAWSGEEARGLEPLKRFRHALPEAVNLAIDRLRLYNYKGIHSVYRGFNDAFKSYFDGANPIDATGELARTGKIMLRPVKGGVMLYRPGEGPEMSRGDMALKKMGLLEKA